MIDDFKQAPERQPVRIDSDPSTWQQDAQTPETKFVTPPVERPLPEFQTPEQIAAETETRQPGTLPGSEELLLAAYATPDEVIPSVSVTPPEKTITLFRRWTVSRKKFIIVSVVAAVLLIGGGTTFALMHQKTAPVKQAAKAKAVAKPAPTPILSPLTGLPVTAVQRDLPVIGAMIENSPDARPQSGLKDAGVVYEAIAEAGITRFLALFQEAQPGNIGPIRSSRPYYLDWAMAFDASYAHVGGSPDALQRIKDIQVRDLDQFFNPGAYHRITTRYAPHNVYTSETQLVDLAKSKGYDKSTFTSFVRKAEKPYVAPAPASTTTEIKTKSTTAAKKTVDDTRKPANSIDLGISSSYYNAHYNYEAATNTYKRSEGGAPHMDADSGTQLSPKVVVALAMPYGLMADGYHSQYTTQGSGKMFVFQDGTVTTGTWTKGDPKSQFVFKDDAGKDLALNPGQTWISIVSDESKVSYQ